MDVTCSTHTDADGARGQYTLAIRAERAAWQPVNGLKPTDPAYAAAFETWKAAADRMSQCGHALYRLPTLR
jgi:hypothetical protein